MSTPNIKHLPDEAAQIAEEQGWDDTSLIIHLVCFIADNVPRHDQALALYFEAIADEENASYEDADEDED